MLLSFWDTTTEMGVQDTSVNLDLIMAEIPKLTPCLHGIILIHVCSCDKLEHKISIESPKTGMEIICVPYYL